ncbi:hypothetical protein EMO92_07370 [Bifidobacterium reuteri]|uniref:Uncharacterized protein n=1 Tax=Bifidobacterium reuteri TaxID=983706 RepID=A0A5J5E7J5_9BIFI|nr:hypothetical protein EMO92_07370 [Bifidobacterium reuteri]
MSAQHREADGGAVCRRRASRHAAARSASEIAGRAVSVADWGRDTHYPSVPLRGPAPLTRGADNTVTELEAQHAAEQSFIERGAELWVYRCEFCGCWHLTHRDPQSSYRYIPLNQDLKPHSRKKGYKPRRR